MPKYNSINNIPALVFFEILEKQDYQLLKPKPKEQGLKEIFTAIYDEYFLKSGNKEALEYLKLSNSVLFLEYKIATIKQIIGFLYYNKTTEKMRFDIIDELKKSLNITIDKTADFAEEVQRVLQVELGIMENDLRFEKIQLESIKTNKSKSAFNYYSCIVGFENVLGRTIEDNMVLAKFIELERLVIKKAKSNGK